MKGATRKGIGGKISSRIGDRILSGLFRRYPNHLELLVLSSGKHIVGDLHLFGLHKI